MTRLAGRAKSALHSLRRAGFALFITSLLSFLAGSILAFRIAHVQQVHADETRVFELMIYHTLPGKVPALESIFRDVSRLQATHNLNALGYWVPTEYPANSDPAWKDTFVYVVAHPSRQAADANWNALHTDLAFLPYRTAAVPLIRKEKGAYQVDGLYLRPADFSAAK